MPRALKFVTNEKGEKVSVILDVDDYKKMLEDLEELEAIRVYDTAKASGEPAIPFRQATDEIERSRK